MSTRIVRPFTIDDAALASTSVAETDALYNAGTTYSAGQIVRRDTTHRRYESVAGSNIGNTPEDTTGGDTPKWIDLGPTNPWAMFDSVNGTQTTDASSIAVEIDVTGLVDSVGLLNIEASTANITATAPGAGEVYNEDFNLQDDTAITDWWAYFFEDIVYKSDLPVTDLPLYADMTVTVTLAKTGTVKIGGCVIGLSKELGFSIYGAKVGIIDYSRKQADDFGNYVVVQRAFSKRASLTVIVAGESMAECASKVDAISKLLAQYRAVPLLWIGADLYTSTVIFGFYRSFDLEIAYPTRSNLTLEIEGLT